jgi:hypothetical protein
VGDDGVAGDATGGVGDAPEGLVTPVILYFALFVLIQIGICVQFYRMTQAAMRVRGRVWYHFAVLALLAVAESIAVLGMYRWTR